VSSCDDTIPLASRPSLILECSRHITRGVTSQKIRALALKIEFASNGKVPAYVLGEVLALPRKSYSDEVGALLPSKAEIPDTAIG
jgi:hypothetical protein